ncbi:hypothetical protein [Streptomyces mirabilis]|uniref:hypothetical protein n=1 Tax=Streptomyces mirabilis TaxID=68239 RepID=UPI0036CC2655
MGLLGQRGQEAWQSLRALALRHPDEGESEPSAAVDELTALAEDPGSAERAHELVAALQLRSAHDPAFARALESWRHEAEAVARTRSGDVHNEISGGTVHGPVVQGRDFNNIHSVGHTSPGPENDPDDDWPQES